MRFLVFALTEKGGRGTTNSGRKTTDTAYIAVSATRNGMLMCGNYQEDGNKNRLLYMVHLLP